MRCTAACPDGGCGVDSDDRFKCGYVWVCWVGVFEGWGRRVRDDGRGKKMAENRAGLRRKARPYERRHLRQQRQMQIPHPGRRVRDDKRGNGFGMTNGRAGSG
jgi:hypothetical protein